MIEGLCNFMSGSSSLCDPPAKYCGIGVVEMFPLIEGQDTTCSGLCSCSVSSKAYSRLCSYIRNFTSKIALTKTFASFSNESSPILVTLSCVKNDENSDRKEKEKTENNKKGYFKVFALYTNAIRLMTGDMSKLQMHPKF